jgi:hypothetical protein
MESSENAGPPLLSVADFEVCVVDAPIAALNQIDMNSISLAYQQAAATVDFLRHLEAAQKPWPGECGS